MGTQAWMRAFTTPAGLFVWLPQAIMYTQAKNGNIRAAERFLWTTKWWAQIMGWLLFPGTIFAAVAIVDADLIRYLGEHDDSDYYRRLLSPRTKAHNWWSWDDDEDNDEYDSSWIERIIAGVVMISLDVAGWVMFYVAYKDSLKYTQYLIASGLKEL